MIRCIIFDLGKHEFMAAHKAQTTLSALKQAESHCNTRGTRLTEKRRQREKPANFKKWLNSEVKIYTHCLAL